MNGSPEYLYRITPKDSRLLHTGPTPDEEVILGLHFGYLEKLAEDGIVLLAGRTLNTDETGFGIVIIRVNSAEEAQQIMENDPAVKNGIMNAEIFPYRIAIKGTSL